MKTIRPLPSLETINEHFDFNFETGQVFRKFVVPKGDAHILYRNGVYRFAVRFNNLKFETMRVDYESISQYRHDAYNILKTQKQLVSLKPSTSGYYKVSIDSQEYSLHRIIYYAYHKADMGLLQVDHIDGNKCNNAINNLRLCDGFGQNGNRGLQKNNKTGVRGVRHFKNRQGNKVYDYWMAEVRQNRKHVFQKLYPFTDDGFKQACAEVELKRKEHFGEYFKV